ncbi:endonuclease G, mitochondrial-like, partial [Anopheles bellator]|uniref:endonuclease G, mitochondrial-like n=1 Tax=Anopheles bellator TaxID=139047 RepID=UPI002647C423
MASNVVSRLLVLLLSRQLFRAAEGAGRLSPVNVSRVGQIMKYGFPGLDNVRSFDNYVLSYDRRTRVAHWVFEHLTPDSVKPNDAVDRAKSDFKADDSINPFFHSLNTDYKGSGFDREHMSAD